MNLATMNRRQFLQTTTATATIILGTNYAEAQNNQLSPQQRETIEQMVAILSGPHVPNINIDEELQKQIALETKQINDPILIGKHVVFDSRWLNYIGQGKPLSRNEFQAGRNRIDNAYEIIKDFVGMPPKKGEKVYVYLGPLSRPETDDGRTLLNDGRTTRIEAFAHSGYNLVVFNSRVPNWANYVKGFNSSTSRISETTVHEIIHFFEHESKWRATHDLTFIIEAYVQQKMGKSTTDIIKKRYNNAVENFMKGTIDRAIYHLHGDSSTEKTVHGFYLNGLVLRVGYEPFRKAFHSYNDDSFKPTHTYSSTYRYTGYQNQVMQSLHVNALELLYRVAYFSGQPNILETFPDEGTLLERFKVTRTPITNP